MRQSRAGMLDGLAELNQQRLDGMGDPEIADPHRAVRDGLPNADLGPRADRHLEGAESTCSTCTARKCEKPARSPTTACWPGGWPSAACASRRSSCAAGTITAVCPASMRGSAQATSIRPCAALIKDLKQRGMLDDTLVVWGGEFGRTVYSQGTLTKDNYGRDHHPRCFTMWMAGGGIKPGIVHGETDDFSYNIVDEPVHIHDLNATMLHLPGHQSREADLPLPGPRLPPDRRAWEGGEGNTGVILPGQRTVTNG